MLIVAERRFTRFVRVLLDLLGGWDVLARFPTKFGSLTEKEYRHGANFTLKPFHYTMRMYVLEVSV